jgi:putative membrane protein
MMWWGHHFGMGFGWVVVALMVIFWGAIIALALWGIKKFTKHNAGSKSNAFDIARERYAKGEINREQFEELKKDLT